MIEQLLFRRMVRFPFAVGSDFTEVRFDGEPKLRWNQLDRWLQQLDGIRRVA
ncbi:MAG TPA: hypothetical protein VGI56_11630 [Galbitalea sp.]|jgi:hypothetical protein